MSERIIREALYVIVAGSLILFALSRIFPAPQPIHAPVAVFSPSPVEREAQAIVDAFAARAASTATTVSPLQQPAVTVIKDTGMLKGLSDAQIAELLSALKPKTVEKVAVGSKLVGPSPLPTADIDAKLYQADYTATVNALHDTTIKTSVDITRQEIPPSRVGSFISAGGSGLSFGIVRHKQYELDLAGVSIENHIAPAVSLQYLLPNTSLGVGPSIIYNHGARIGVAATVHF